MIQTSRLILIVFFWLISSVEASAQSKRTKVAPTVKPKAGPGDQEKIEDIIYQADIIKADLDKGSAILKGNVVIYFEGYKLTAPEAEIIKAESRFTANGGVKIENLMTKMSADKVEIFFDNNSGILTNARIESGQMLLEAAEIKKLDKEVFEANDSTFTTCMTCPPLWRFGAKEIKTNIKKYIDIKWATLQAGGQPIFWLPRLILPVNTRRKTGVLAPEPIISTSRGQFGLAQGFFWAISDDKDLTFTPVLYSKSGLKTLVNYRQAFDSQSRAELNFGYMKDNDFSVYNFDTGNENVLKQSRWFLDFKNQIYLPNHFVQKSNIRLISDLIYLADFPDEIRGQREANIENQVSIVRNKDKNHVSAEIVYNINLLTEDFESKNLDSVHRTPQLKYSRINSVFLKNFRFGLDTEYNKFTRKGLSFDQVVIPGGGIPKEISNSVTGNFDPSRGLIRAGQRMLIQPNITGSFNLGNKMILLPKLSMNQGFYAFTPEFSPSSSPNVDDRSYDELAARTYIQGEVALKTRFDKVINENWKHIVEPSVSMTYGEVVSETDHVFFRGTRDLPYYRRFQPISDRDFFDYDHGIQFDYYDRVENTQVFKISLLQTLLKKNSGFGAETNYYTQPLFFELSQNYDFIEAKRYDPDQWSTLNALLKFTTKNFETFTIASHFHKIKKTNFSTRNKYIYKAGHFVSSSYKNNYLIDRDNAERFHQEFFGLGLGWKFPRVNFSGELLYSTLDKEVQQWNARFGYVPLGDCLEIFFNIYDNIDRRQANTPDIKLQVVWNFGQGNERPSDIKAVF